jgi:hypothetical protein
MLGTDIHLSQPKTYFFPANQNELYFFNDIGTKKIKSNQIVDFLKYGIGWVERS